MKTVIYSRNNLNQLEAKIVENQGLNLNGNVIAFKRSLIEEMDETFLKENRINKVEHKNIVFYTFEDRFTLVIFKNNEVYKLNAYQESNKLFNIGKEKGLLKAIITDEKIGDKLLSEVFVEANKSIFMNISGNREIPRVTLSRVSHLEMKKVEGNVKRRVQVVGRSYPVALPRVLCDIEDGRLSGLKLLEEDVYNIVDLEAHHKNAVWDNRLKSIVGVDAKEHKELHKEFGHKRHHVAVKITNTEELEAFVKLMSTDYWR